jgi:hypothetical protein
MGFVQRAFTPPGTGGAEARAIQAATDAAAAQAAKAVPTLPKAPEAGTAPAAPPQLSAGSAPGVQRRAQITASTMLGAAAAGGQKAKTVLG